MGETTTSPRLLRFGVFEVDFRAGELRKQGLRIKLQEQPCQILALLVEHPGQVVTREELRSRLWPRDTFVDFDHSLNTAIMRLRDALGDSSENPRFVETLPKRGYRFIAPVDAVVAPEPESHPPVQPESLLKQNEDSPETAATLPGSLTKIVLALQGRRRWSDLRRFLTVAAMLAIGAGLALGL